MEQLKTQVSGLSQRLDEMQESQVKVFKALFGDFEDMRSRPGVLHELRSLEKEQKTTNEKLDTIIGTFRKLVMLLIGAIITGIVTIVVTLILSK